ncbi:MAG TPA: hypothetical protein VFS90_04240 [Pyrinomonadaceae bacterium]|nr:hypothetical protein [Pyrinomonadaceae bacterium]
MMSKYIIAPKREFRSVTPRNWQEDLKNIQGVQVIGSQPARVHVEATAQGIDRLRSMLGNMYHIEKAITHRTI